MPPLYVFNASVDTVCAGKYRRIPVAEFIAGPGRTVLQPGEVVTSVRLARGPSGRNSGYYKVGKRQAMAIAVASLAALVTPEKNGRRQIRLAWGSVGPTVMTAPAIESFLADRSFTEENLRQAGALVSEFVQPIDDLRASAGYRRQLAANLLLIVLFSGYENFVSKLDLEESRDRPSWMGKVDFSGLKMKLIASIVAISGIHLLKVFMEVGKSSAPVDEVKMQWMVIIHLTLVASGVLLALMESLASKTDKH